MIFRTDWQPTMNLRTIPGAHLQQQFERFVLNTNDQSYETEYEWQAIPHDFDGKRVRDTLIFHV